MRESRRNKGELGWDKNSHTEEKQKRGSRYITKGRVNPSHG
jgi:hypothetical protein